MLIVDNVVDDDVDVDVAVPPRGRLHEIVFKFQGKTLEGLRQEVQVQG